MIGMEEAIDENQCHRRFIAGRPAALWVGRILAEARVRAR